MADFAHKLGVLAVSPRRKWQGVNHGSRVIKNSDSNFRKPPGFLSIQDRPFEILDLIAWTVTELGARAVISGRAALRQPIGEPGSGSV